MQQHREIQGVRVPAVLYGTAWKEDATEGLVVQALQVGFRGIDTANQRRHYYEEGVGRALRAALDGGAVSRDELFVQTKFTFVGGQDHRLPYDPRAPVAAQVGQSLDSSLSHLGVSALDSLVLHGPSRRVGLGPADEEAWRAMEALHEEGRTRLLGVSNVSVEQLLALCELAKRPPAFVQNRCFARLGWDHDVRAVCDRYGIVYQGFSLLTANPHVLAAPAVVRVADALGRTPAQVIFRFCRQLGMITLTGTTDRRHMEEDLAVGDFELSPEQMDAVSAAG